MKTIDRKLTEKRFEEIKEKWSELMKIEGHPNYEFYKGQFLILREILYPEKYNKETVNNRRPLQC